MDIHSARDERRNAWFNYIETIAANICDPQSEDCVVHTTNESIENDLSHTHRKYLPAIGGHCHANTNSKLTNLSRISAMDLHWPTFRSRCASFLQKKINRRFIQKHWQVHSWPFKFNRIRSRVLLAFSIQVCAAYLYTYRECRNKKRYFRVQASPRYKYVNSSSLSRVLAIVPSCRLIELGKLIRMMQQSAKVAWGWLTSLWRGTRCP